MTVGRERDCCDNPNRGVDGTVTIVKKDEDDFKTDRLFCKNCEQVSYEYEHLYYIFPTIYEAHDN